MVVVVGGDVLHHVNCPGGGMSGECVQGECPDPYTTAAPGKNRCEYFRAVFSQILGLYEVV